MTSLEKYLLNKLWKRGLPDRPHYVLELHTNYSLLSNSVPHYFRSDTFDILMNAVPTGRRTLPFTLPSRAERIAAPSPPASSVEREKTPSNTCSTGLAKWLG